MNFWVHNSLITSDRMHFLNFPEKHQNLSNNTDWLVAGTAFYPISLSGINFWCG